MPRTTILDGDLMFRNGLWLGNDYDDKNKNGPVIAYNGDGHMLTIGPTRSGKSRRLLIPNLLYETGRSMLVVDIKGELAAITAAHRAAKGGNVVALDPFGVLPTRGVEIPSVGFNPMRRLNPELDDFVDDAMGLAEALVQVRPGDSEPHWAEFGARFRGRSDYARKVPLWGDGHARHGARGDFAQPRGNGLDRHSGC